MVFEAAKMMVYSKIPKEKIWAIRLLKAMEDSNHRPRVLPAQQFGKDLMDPSMDLREVIAVPGSSDDYAD